MPIKRADDFRKVLAREGLAASVLASQGITYEPARDAIIEELRRGRGMTPPAPSA